jgi:pilus assembly protein CpaD
MINHRAVTARSGAASRRWRLVSCAASAAVLSVLLASCSSPPKGDIVGSVPDDYHLVHPISYAEGLETMDIPVGVDMARLPGPMQATVAGFGQRFIGSGSGILAIVAPVGTPNQVAAASVSHQIRDLLIAAGVGAREIEFRSYRAGPDEPGAPVRLAYNRMAARTEPCQPWTDEVTHSSENEHYRNFGCATQQNLAAEIENPLDLMYPRGTTPADAGRRSTVLQKYRKGDAYQTDYSKEPGGAVATGVGQ